MAVGNEGTVLTSPDGVDWIDHYSTCVNTLRDVIYSGGVFTVVGNNEAILRSSLAAPRLRVAGRSDALRLEIQPVVGVLHVLEGSSDLQAWTVLSSFLGTEDEVSVVVPPWPVPVHGFYRLRLDASAH